MTGLDKAFDYRVPPDWTIAIQAGDVVRVDLNGRRVRGWVIGLDPPDGAQRATAALVKWSSRGPDQSLIELAQWASIRWGAGRLRPFLVGATPPVNVTGALDGGAPRSMGAAREPSPPAGAVRVIRLGPTLDPLPVVLDAIRGRRALVLHPAAGGARALARRLAKAGLSVALWPDEWARAARGVDVVVGTRAVAWARIPGLEAAVVLDEHDEALQSERTPTWHARDVLAERLVDGALTLVSPCPSVTAVRLGGPSGVAAATSFVDERDSWPTIDVVDRSPEPPWKRSLITSELIVALRDHDRRVVVVSNAPGRARMLSCRACRSLLRCTSCAAAVHQDDGGALVCARCDSTRPALCQVCGSTALANVRPGVTRLREELEAAAARPVAQVTAATAEIPDASVYVGTEAVLHRVGRVDVVAFADFDAELLAPRYRAAEQAMTLLIRAGRLVGGRRGGGRVLVQTHLPDHEVLVAARTADIAAFTAAEASKREQLGLPPFGALAVVEGTGHGEFAAGVARAGVQAVSSPTRSMLRSASWTTLGEAIVGTHRPAGVRLRVEVDPPR